MTKINIKMDEGLKCYTEEKFNMLTVQNIELLAVLVSKSYTRRHSTLGMTVG